MKLLAKTIVAAAAVLATTLVAVPVEARPGGGAVGFHGGGGFHGGSGFHGGFRGGYWGHRGWGPGPFWGGIGLGLGLGAIAYSSYYGPYGYYDGYYDPGVVVAQPAPYVTVEPAMAQPAVRSGGQPVPQSARTADPIFYPKSGQSAARTETDRQECNRWATTQPNAMNDSSIFQRATFACMEGRGYSVR